MFITPKACSIIGNDGIEGILPGAGRNARICARQIRLGNQEIELRLPGGFIAGVEQGGGFGAVFGAQAFLFASLGVLDVEHAAKFAAVEHETIFHSSDFYVQSYAKTRGLRCISYTKRAANPVISSGCRVVPGWFKGSTPVIISLALSLALPSSGCSN